MTFSDILLRAAALLSYRSGLFREHAVAPNAETLIADLDRIFVEQFEVAAETVVPEARLREDLELDSLDAADMMIAIEKRFGVRLDDQVARTFKTVGDIHAHVRKLVADKLSAEQEGTGGARGDQQAAG